MVSGGLAIEAATTVDKDTTLFSHYPVQLQIGGKLSEDLGVRIRRPSAFVGITKKEANTIIIPEGDFKTKRSNRRKLDQMEPRGRNLSLSSGR
eukprot:12887987-Heterocapsa_arctica.AAC.1